MLQDIMHGLKAFYEKPYDQDGDALSWALFLGFTIAITFLWTRVIRALIEA